MTLYPWPTHVETVPIHAEALVDAVGDVTDSSWMDGRMPWET
jgi:hypothetical protein